MLKKFWTGSRKAWFGGLVTGLTSLQLALDDDQLSFAEWREAVIAGALAFFVVYNVPNDEPVVVVERI
jgi:hypothetical protein